jgi:putative transposase
MPRANRSLEPGHTYHVTHRCHDRSFLFGFAIDRQAYRTMLRERLDPFNISLLNYCITSNHTHLLVRVRDHRVESLARFMQSLEGDFALYYNRRKKRSGAFWSDRYHAAMIQNGRHLWRCLAYIDLNMVRAGEVNHPSEWEWTGYRELMGMRKRNRLIDTAALCRAVELEGPNGLAEFRQRHQAVIEEAIALRELRREPIWTESIAVGEQDWIQQVGGRIPNRLEVIYERQPDQQNTWSVREPTATYSP